MQERDKSHQHTRREVTCDSDKRGSCSCVHMEQRDRDIDFLSVTEEENRVAEHPRKFLRSQQTKLW